MATNTSKNQSTETAKPPVAKLRLGLINASIWERVTDNGNRYSVTFERRYRDTNGEWHSTYSYDAGDLLVLAKLADQAKVVLLSKLICALASFCFSAAIARAEMALPSALIPNG